MAFWSMAGSLSMAGATEKVLNRDSFTLKDLLDCDDILSQVLAPDETAIYYLSQPEIIEELVSLAIAPPPSRTPNAEEDEDEAESGSEAEDGRESSPEAEEHTPEKENAKDDHSEHSPKNSSETERKDADDEKREEEETKIDTSPRSDDSVEYREFKDKKDESDDSDSESKEKFEEERLRQIRYSKISAEILNTDVWMLLDALLSNDQAMYRLWSVLETKHDASAQQLSLLTKIVEGLLEKRLDRMLEFIRTLPHFVDYFIRYIECQPLVDFLIKIISTDHPESPTDIIDFLYGQDLIPKMIELLGPDVPHSAQSAAGDFLKAFVNISGGNKSDICAIGPNELSRQFVGFTCMRRLIQLMLKGGHGMCVAVTVIIEAIRKNNSDYDMIEVTDTTLETHPPDPRDNIYLGTMVKLFAEAIPKFQEMLTAPETKTMKMPFGEIKPLGFDRFRICELYAELLHCSNMNLLNDPVGEQIIRERDAERVRVFFPERDLPNVDPAEVLNAMTAVPKAEENSATPSDTDDAVNKDQEEPEDPNTEPPSQADKEEAEEDVLDDDSSSSSSSPVESADLTRSAHAPDTSPPASPAGSIDSPARSPSPPTPEGHSGDDLEYMDDNHQKINISSYRGKQLDEFLERESRTLRRKAVVGDQLKIALDDNKCIDAVLKMLFEFPWNNFLHNVVFDIVQQVFNGYIDHSYNKFLAIHLFSRANLTEQIVKGQRANEEHEREKNIRLGYVGHLTLISEEVVKFGSLFVAESVSPKVAEALEDHDWIEYVHNDLLQLREQYNTVLGKVSLIEDDDGYDAQEEDERRVFALELDLNEEPDSRLRQLQPHVLRIDSDSDNDSNDDSDSSSDNEDVAIIKHNSNSREDDDDDKEDSEEDDEPTGDLKDNSGIDELPRLRPQGHHHSAREDDDAKDEADAKSADRPKKSSTKKAPKDESEFARYMSKQLNSDQFSSGSSEEEDEDAGTSHESEGWVPVDAKSHSEEQSSSK